MNKPSKPSSTPSEDKTAALQDILETLVKTFASKEKDSDGIYWWGHDTNLGDCKEAFDEAEQAIRNWCIAQLVEKCEICNINPVTRRGVETRETIRLTYGHFCDTCIAYPNSSAVKPNDFEIEKLEPAANLASVIKALRGGK